MSTPYETSNGAGGSNDYENEPNKERIMRYCFGRRPMPEEDLDADAAVPPFGRLKYFQIDEQGHEKLWRFEIKRLKDAAEAPNVDLLQPKIKLDNTLGSWAVTKSHSYKLGRLADQILYGLWVFSYEDEAVLQNYNFPSSKPERSLKVFWNFQRILGKIPDLPFTNRSRKTRQRSGEATHPEKSWGETFNNPRLKVIETDQYCYVVDQITSILAKIAWSCSSSSYWKMVVLACLTKISTKLKALATRLPTAVENCMKAHRLNEQENEESEDNLYNGRRPAPKGDKQRVIANYCEENMAVSTWLVECIEHVLRNLGAESPLYGNCNHLDVCTLIYEAGTSGIPTHVYQDSWAGVSGSTDRLGITWAMTALGVGSKLLKTGPPPAKCSSAEGKSNKALKDPNPHGNPSEIVDHEAGAVIQFTAEVDNIYRVKNIESIIDLVVMMTPLSLASPILGRGFADNIGAISSRATIYWGMPHEILSANAFSSMQRIERRCDSRGSPSIQHVFPREGYPETTSLSHSWLVGHRYDSFWRKPSSNSFLQHPNPKPPQPPRLRARKNRERVKRFTDEWIIHEKSIVIKYPTYVNTVFGLTVVLVVGGFLCSLLVGSRVEGVDPFNFTAFSWLLGGFILLFAKIAKVSDWTWRDFLLRQVTCRSVCEVANVSKGNLSQDEVLCYLLSSENQHILRTSGPFQKVFAKEAVENGFSIDVSPDVRTLLASGIVAVKVLTVDGEALLWLRLIPGSGPVQKIPVFGKADDAGTLVCVDMPRPDECSESIALNRQKLSWTQVLGVYNEVEKRIR